MTAPYSYVDEHLVLHEAVCQLRPIAPEYDPLVDEYLTVAGGKHAEKLKDWLASFSDLSKPTCALYFRGAPGTGKTLIPLMLGQMYHGADGPTRLASVIDAYNEDLARCPIVNADEQMPSPRYGKGSSGLLRDMITATTRPLSRKYVSNSPLTGCLRVILGANNDKMLAFDEDLGAHDLDAVNRRYLCIEMGDDVQEWLRSRGGNKLTSLWMRDGEDRFAKHLMWLRASRQVEVSDRLLVEGEASEVQAMTATSGDIREATCNWIVGLLEQPQSAMSGAGQGLVIVDRDGLWINSAAILNTWDTYVKHSAVKPTVGRIGRALAGLSTKRADKDTLRQTKKAKLKFHLVNQDLVFHWAESNGHGDVSAMRAALTNWQSFKFAN